MEDTHQPPHTPPMPKLHFNGHDYVVDTLVRLAGTMPAVVHPYAELQNLLESVMRVPNLNYPVVTHHEGKLVVLMLPDQFVAPKMSLTNVKCRLATKHVLKRAATLEQPLGYIEPPQPERDDRPRRDPIMRSVERHDRGLPPNHATGAHSSATSPLYRAGPPPISPTRPTGPRPIMNRVSAGKEYPTNNVDIRKALPAKSRLR